MHVFLGTSLWMKDYNEDTVNCTHSKSLKENNYKINSMRPQGYYFLLDLQLVGTYVHV